MNEKEAANEANEREKSESDHICGAFFARMTMLRVQSRYAKKELMTEQSESHDERKHWDLCRSIIEVFFDVLVVNNAVLIELKSAQTLDVAHRAQVLNYLRCTDFEVALLLNFGPKPAFKRLVFENSRKGIRVSSRASAGS